LGDIVAILLQWTLDALGCLQCAGARCMFPLISAVDDCGSQAVADFLKKISGKFSEILNFRKIHNPTAAAAATTTTTTTVTTNTNTTYFRRVEDFAK